MKNKTLYPYLFCALTLVTVVSILLFFSNTPSEGDAEQKPENVTVSENESKNMDLGNASYSVPQDKINKLADEVSLDLESAVRTLRAAIYGEDSPESRKVIDQALAKMNRENIGAFLDLIEEMTEGGNYAYAFERFAALWTGFEPESAMNFVIESDAELDIANGALEAAMEVWFGNAPDDAMNFAKDYPSNDDRPRAIKAFAQSVVSVKGEDAALEWVDGIESNRFRNQSGEHIGYLAAAKNPELAKAWIQSLEKGGGYSVYLTRGISKQLAEQDHMEAMSWAESIERLSLRREAVAGSIRYWAQADPVEAAKWISRAEVDMISDSVLSSYIHGAYRENPEVTLMALEGVRRRQTRAELDSMIREYWKNTDPEVYNQHFPAEETN